MKTGADARDTVGFDAGKRVKGRKRHLLTDTLGLMLRIEAHSAGVQDRDGAALVLDRITRRFPFIERIFADAGYQGPRVAAAAPRPVEIIKRTDAGFVVQPKRWVVERTFAWACINRRLARDAERAAETVRALFQIAMIKLRPAGSPATRTSEADSEGGCILLCERKQHRDEQCSRR